MMGLATRRVKEAITSNESVMRDLFVFSAAPLDATTVDNLFVITGWSPVGSNRFKDQKRTQTHWRDYLQDLEGLRA
jgi:hypothetical protein